MQAIWKRISVRNFIENPVPLEIIDVLLDAGMQAPSAGNAKPWHFVVEDRKEQIKKITLFHPYSKMLNNAPIIIVVCSEPEKEKFEGFWPQDCAACTENILLAATHIGLGSVWLGIYPCKERMDGIKKLFNLPDNIIPFAIVALGYPASMGQEKKRYDVEKIHYGEWGEKWMRPAKNNIFQVQSFRKNTMKICIKDIEIFSYHGVYDFEKENGQLFLISIEIGIKYDIKNNSDSIEQTIDYAKVYKEICQISKENKYNLIESLAQHIALAILREFSEVFEVSVKVKKPDAPIEGNFKYVGAEIKLIR